MAEVLKKKAYSIKSTNESKMNSENFNTANDNMIEEEDEDDDNEEMAGPNFIKNQSIKSEPANHN